MLIYFPLLLYMIAHFYIFTIILTCEHTNHYSLLCIYKDMNHFWMLYSYDENMCMEGR